MPYIPLERLNEPSKPSIDEYAYYANKLCPGEKMQKEKIIKNKMAKARSQRTPTQKPVKPQKDIPYPQGISVCVSAYKAEDYIEECLDSIASQTWFASNDNWEILLGIDGCAETLSKVKEIMPKYKNLKVFVMKNNVGTYVTCNTIMCESKYKWLLRFDSDDIMPDDMVEKLFSKDLNGVDAVKYDHQDFGNGTHRGVAWGSHMIRHNTFDKYGGYRNWRISADYDFLYRIEPTAKIITARDIFYNRRVHENSLEYSEETNLKSKKRNELNTFVKNQSRKQPRIKITTTEHTIVYNSCKTPVSGKKYNNEPVIISMTSWKKRINSTHIAIESIISQCEKSHIVLVLSEEEFPLKEKELPVSITRLMELDKIELLWVYDNTKAFKKVIPTMRKYKNVPIISADDDLTYTRDYASELYNTFIKDKSVFCVSYRHSKMITPCGAATLYNPLYYDKIISTFNKRFVTLLEDDMYMQYIIEKNKLKSKFVGSGFPFRTINANDENALSKSYKDGTTALERKNKCFAEYNGTIGAKVVVNITTWAKRDYCLYPMLSNLKKQTRYPDRIVLWLSEEEYDKNKLPRTIQRCVDGKLLTDIMWVKKNTKGHKRYDCFKYFNNCYNILLDDDILYRPRFIEELLNESKKHQDCITVYSSRTIDYIGVKYIEKQFSPTPSHTNVFIAGRCCFPPYIFPFDAYENEELRNEYVLNCDESWYRPFFIKHDIRIHVMHQWDNNYYPEIKESQKNSLWNYNKRMLGNGMRDKERNFYNAIKITHTEELCKRIWKNIGIDNYVIQK